MLSSMRAVLGLELNLIIANNKECILNHFTHNGLFICFGLIIRQYTLKKPGLLRLILHNFSYYSQQCLFIRQHQLCNDAYFRIAKATASAGRLL